MKYTKLTAMIFGLLLSCFTLASAAKAEGSRSYIAPSGSDNRPCSRAQPCRTFDGALAKTDAGGEIIALETGTYEPTTITKSITLTAAPSADVVIRATSGNAVTINVSPVDLVVLRGLKLSGPGQNSNVNGVLVAFESQGTILIENCVISNFATGVHMVIDKSARLGISDSVIRNNLTGLTAASPGTEAMGAFASRTRFERNQVGVRAPSGKPTVLRDCVVSGNNTGLRTEQNGALIITSSLVTKNSVGIEIATGRAFIASSVISSNTTGIESTGTVRSVGNNVFTENDIDISGPPAVLASTM